jgi:Zn-dependent protease/predicted RNA-binding Zn-ribbon protein involved in translation (DUF1610 family)
MPRFFQGSLRLGRIAGIDLFLHWSWFVVAVIEIEYLKGRYTSPIWSMFEYLALFAIVLLHEFGHALACRSVGGTANRIMLWPLGGVAFVDPPQRPGATLWSLAAGPLVNVALFPIFYGAVSFAGSLGWAHTMPDAYHLVGAIFDINILLLAFNILPIYPLDGGQILRSLLWFVMGRTRSLMVATVLGFIGAALLIIVGLVIWQSTWTVVIAAYMLLTCWGGFQSARAMIRVERLPRRQGFACPNCGANPPTGALWKCAQCKQSFDTFETGAVCPHCGSQFPNTMCGECQKMHPISEWQAAAYARQSAANTGSLAR